MSTYHVVPDKRPAYILAKGAPLRKIPPRSIPPLKVSLKHSPTKNRRTVRLHASAASKSVPLDVSGGNGGGKDKNVVYTAEEGEPNFFHYNSLVDALVKGGMALGDIPHDIREAMLHGFLEMKDIRRWIRIARVPILGPLCRAAPAIRNRVLGNPRFLTQLMVELFLGLSAKMAAEMKARADKCFKEELPFFLSDMALEAFADISLVFLLSPKRNFKALPKHRLVRGIAKLPSHAMQGGYFHINQRMAAILYRSLQFFFVGAATSAAGHSITKWAVERQAGPNKDTHLAPVLDNSLAFGSFMAISSNARYQTVNCLEERILDAFIPTRTLNILATLLLRFANCYLGGVQWVWFAKESGLQ